MTSYSYTWPTITACPIALAEALRQSGADRAMQLDINSFWVRFVTFRPHTNQLPQAQKLLATMAGNSQQFVTPDSRDFFYVTRKDG